MVLLGTFYDPIAMMLETRPMLFAADKEAVMVIQPGFEASRPLVDLDFARDTVRIGRVDVDSDQLRWALEARGL